MAAAVVGVFSFFVSYLGVWQRIDPSNRRLQAIALAVSIALLAIGAVEFTVTIVVLSAFTVG